MSGHTPGPWFNGRALRGGQECIVGDGDSVVAFMPDATIGRSFIADDARLIAAAPELLEALTVAREWMRGDKWRNSTIEKNASWERLCEALIAPSPKPPGSSHELSARKLAALRAVRRA